MKSISFWISESSRLSKLIARNQFQMLGGLFLFLTVNQIFIEDAMRPAAKMGSQPELGYLLAMVALSLLETFAVFLILSRGVAAVRNLKPPLLPRPFENPFLASFFAEYFRMFGQILLFALFLVIPGLIRALQLIFVPFIALFSESYREGNLDALQASKIMTRPILWQIFGVVVATALIALLTEFLPHMVEAFQNYPMRVTFAFINFLFSIWTYSLIYILFESSLEQLKAETK